MNTRPENFTVQYRFSSLAALGDHIANKAVEKRASAAKAKPKRKGELLAEAAAMESDAFLVRNSMLDGVPLTAKDIREFTVYLRNCTDDQVRGVYEKEQKAGREVYAQLAFDERERRAIGCREQG